MNQVKFFNIINLIGEKSPKYSLKRIYELLPFTPMKGGYVNNKGRQGLWKEKTYDQSELHYDCAFAVGNYVDDLKEGEWKEYNDDKNLIWVQNYKKGMLVGEAISYFPNGSIAGRGKYLNGEKEGEWIFYKYFKSIYDKPKSILNYHNGLYHGEHIEYYDESDQIKRVEMFKNGHKDGISLEFYEDGLPALVRKYKNGKREGITQAYYKNGNLEYETEYKDGRYDGIYKEYYDDGDIKEKGEYSKGLKHGTFYYYANNKKLLEKGNYFEDRRDGMWYSYSYGGKFKRKTKWNKGILIMEK